MLKRASISDDGSRGKGKGKPKRSRVTVTSDGPAGVEEDERGVGLEMDIADLPTDEANLSALWELVVSNGNDGGSALPEPEDFDLCASDSGEGHQSLAGTAAGENDENPNAKPSGPASWRSVPTALMDLIGSGIASGSNGTGLPVAETFCEAGRRELEGDITEEAKRAYRETFRAAHEIVRVEQEQRLRRYLLSTRSAGETSPLLEEIAVDLESRAQRLRLGTGTHHFGVDFSPWLGLRSVADLLENLRADQKGRPNSPIVARICRAIMEQVVLLDEDQLEEEGLEPLGLLVRNLYPMVAYNGDQMRGVFRFIADLVLRHIKAPSLPMRRWGWEQAIRLIDLGRRHRWHYKAYLVEGAGSTCCNGIYRVAPEAAGNPPPTAYLRRSLQAPKYYFQGQDVFSPRKLMQYNNPSTKAFWWFISEPDPASSAGLAGDVLYYCRKSKPTENFMPPRNSGWLKRAAGRGLPPTVTPLVSEGYLCPPGEEYNSLEWELADWIVRNRVVEGTFGDRMHRQDVVGSGKLLQFLCGMEDKLTAEHLDLIWSASIRESSAELQGTVFKLLTALVSNMNSWLVVHLVGRLQMAVEGDTVWGKRDDVLEFLECLVADKDHVAIARNETVRSATARLVWSLLRDPSVLTHKSCKPVCTLLASVSYRPASGLEGEGNLNVGKFLERCVARWQESSPARGADVSRSVEAVRHMLDNFDLNHVQELAQLYYAFPLDPDANRQVVEFIAESGSFAECYVCAEPLLNNVGTSKFGLISWSCRCTVLRKAHSACIFSKICHGQPNCDMCHTPMSFAKSSGSGQEVTIRVHSPGEHSGDKGVGASGGAGVHR